MSNQKNILGPAKVMLAVVLAVTLVLASDSALAWGKKKKEPKEEPTKAVNLDKHPTMNFYRGVLRLDTYGGWFLDQQPLSFNRNSRISDTPGSSGGTELIEGRTARVTAANVGGTLIVHRVTMMTQEEMYNRGIYNTGSSTEELESGSSSTPQ